MKYSTQFCFISHFFILVAKYSEIARVFKLLKILELLCLVSKKLPLLTISILTIFFFLSCNNKLPDKIYNEKSGGTFKWFITDPVEQLNPINILYSSDMVAASLIFEGLVGYGQKVNEFVPLIAESWQILDNGKRYLFNIRKGVKFHNNPCFKNGLGRDLVLDDIVKTFERIADPKNEGPFWPLFSKKILGIDEFHSGKLKTISGIRKINNTQIEFTLTKPFVTFLSLLATPGAYITPFEAWDVYKEQIGNHPVGTGPFRLAVWNPVEEMIFVRNESYWGKTNEGNRQPLLDEILIKPHSNPLIIYSELIKGENFLHYMNPSNLKKIEKAKEFNEQFKIYKIDNGLSFRFFGFSFNRKLSPISNVNLRQLIKHNLDKKLLMNDVEENFVFANSVVPGFLYDRQGLILNKNSEQNKTNPEITYSTTPRLEILSSIHSEDIKMLEKALNKLNIKHKVNILPNKYYQEITEREPDIFRVSMTPVYPDPEEYFNLFYSKNHELNLMHYKSSEFDEIFEESMFEQNPEKRTKLFIKLEQILNNDLPCIPLTHEAERYYAFPKFVKGLIIKNSIPDFRNVWLDKP